MKTQICGVCGDALCKFVIIPHAHAFLVQFFLSHDLVFFFLFGLQHMFHLFDPTYKGETTKQTMEFFIWSHILWNVHQVLLYSQFCA
jgi:hypothetical protein